MSQRKCFLEKKGLNVIGIDVEQKAERMEKKEKTRRNLFYYLQSHVSKRSLLVKEKEREQI